MTDRSVPEAWHRLDPRTLAYSTLWAGGGSAVVGIPVGIGFANGTSPVVALAVVVPIAVLVVAAGALAELVRLRRTRFRVGDDLVELESGILVRRRRVLQRERIRSVDLTADPVARALGLVKVSVGTGERASSGNETLALTLVSREAGDHLRSRLLLRGAADASAEDTEGRLARLDPSWIRYAPLSFLTPVLGFTAFGVVMQVADWFRLAPRVVDWVLGLFEGLSLSWTIVVLLIVSQVVGVVGSLAVFVETWGRYRLDREPGGTLRVRRGLFTTRSISLEERRLRGIELVEPLGTRLAGGARVDAVATGMTHADDEKKTDRHILLPAAPRGVALRVSTDVLRAPGLWADTGRLIAHPIAARTRRIRWALAAVLVVLVPVALVGVLVSTIVLHAAWIAALVLVPTAVLLAIDAHRGLGHAVSGEYLIARSGTVRRATVALRRSGVVGWTARRSIFQRRSGLLTFAVTTAAGAGEYRIIDASEDEVLRFAGGAFPDLLLPFLEPIPPGDRRP